MCHDIFKKGLECSWALCGWRVGCVLGTSEKLSCVVAAAWAPGTCRTVSLTDPWDVNKMCPFSSELQIWATLFPFAFLVGLWGILPCKFVLLFHIVKKKFKPFPWRCNLPSVNCTYLKCTILWFFLCMHSWNHCYPEDPESSITPSFITPPAPAPLSPVTTELLPVCMPVCIF